MLVPRLVCQEEDEEREQQGRPLQHCHHALLRFARPTGYMSCGPADANRHPFVWIEAAQDSEVDDVVLLLDLRFRRCGSGSPGIAGDACGNDCIGKHDARVHGVDRHRPAVAGDVPVQLVERGLSRGGEEESNRVGDAVADDNLPVGVARAGNVDVEPVGPTLVDALFFYLKSPAIRVGDVADRDVEPDGAALRGVVVERDVAVDSVPLACEADCELFGDIERSIGANGEQRIEVPDADGASLRARGTREREESEKERPTNR